MSTESLSTFFALLTFAGAAGAVLGIAVGIGASLRPESLWGAARDGIADVALWIAGIVALVTMLGSLYYSLVAHFEPCELCWYQRICIYPLAPILLVAAVRRDRHVWKYAVVPVVAGLVIAVYHTQLQAFPAQHSFCQLSNPCTNRYVWKFGFVSLPLMDLVSFGFIATMLWLAAMGTTGSTTQEDSL